MRTIAVLGDLHFEQVDQDKFDAARKQLADLNPNAVFQLGDLGGYSHCGSWKSFQEGRDFLSGFDRPFFTVLGNHDLEGAEYATDEQSIAAWSRMFGYARPYYTVDLGQALAICLSTTSFRSNPASHHEIRLDAEQIRWLRQTLEANRRRPTFVFVHVPPMGSGLRVLQNVHIRCPNAWLNHTERPEQFIALVREFPQIKLWFSAHNHLGQQYAGSITTVGNCTFAHTGVIGPVSRDGLHQSRLVEFDDAGFTLFTVDHGSGQRMADWHHAYDTGRSQRLSPVVQPVEVLHFAPLAMPTNSDRLEIGRSVFGIHRGMLVEYDRPLAAAIGVVCDLAGDEQIELCGRDLEVTADDGEVQSFSPGCDGRYYQIFTPNPHANDRADDQRRLSA